MNYLFGEIRLYPLGITDRPAQPDIETEDGVLSY